MTDDEVLDYVRTRLPEFEPTGRPEQLPEGNLNVVWRVPGRPDSIIVKFAPPYVATNPDIPLDPSRLIFEARALEALGPDGRLAEISTSAVRAPHPLDVNAGSHVLVMEDIGAYPTLGEWVQAGGGCGAAASIGKQLGRFIGQLHVRTYRDEELAQRFDNRAMQKTRYAVQYQAVEEMLERAGVRDAGALGARAEALGQRLLEPGMCLTMGDLWPPSVLVVDDGLRIIDWELTHFGAPVQDMAHFAAHGWMLAHRAPSSEVRAATRKLMETFLQAYQSVATSSGLLLQSAMQTDFGIHFGAEILVRTVGRFQEGYLYEGCVPEAPVVQEAVDVAATHIRHPEQVDLFAPLF